MATQRYAAFLRGVMPTNAKMPALKRAFEAAGFTDVKTVLGSGNVVFSARAAGEAALQRKAEAAMAEQLGRTFLTMVRSLDALREILDADPYAGFPLPAGSKRVVTFLRDPARGKPALPRAAQARAAGRAGRRAHPEPAGRRAVQRLCPGPARPGVHDADPEDLRRRGDQADLGDR